LLEPLILRKIGPNGAKPEWWKAWILFVEAVALFRSWKTSEMWASAASAAWIAAKDALRKIPQLYYLMKKKDHAADHIPRQGVAWGPPYRATSEFRLEAEHQPHKASARAHNRKMTRDDMMADWAESSAAAFFSGDIFVPDVEPLQVAKHREAVRPLALASAERRCLLDVLQVTGRLDAAETEVLWFGAVKYMGKPIEIGRWVMVTTTGVLQERLAHVDSIYSVDGIFVLALNVYPPTSLVTTDSGKLVSMDPRVRLESAVTDAQIVLRMERASLLLLLPLEKVYLREYESMVCFVPM
jgi:hypothetical protein